MQGIALLLARFRDAAPEAFRAARAEVADLLDRGSIPLPSPTADLDHATDRRTATEVEPTHATATAPHATANRKALCGGRDDRAEAAFVDVVLAELMPALDHVLATLDGRPSPDLVRLTLTAPEGFGPLARTLRDFAATFPQGALLALDRRTDGRSGRDVGEHAYGVALLDGKARAAALDEWLARTGGTERYAQTVRGWRQFAEHHDATALRRNLGHVIAYAFKPYPGREPRDLDTEVTASGPLAGPWERVRASGLAPERPTAPQHFPGITQTVGGAPRECAVCGRSLAGRRRQARTCSTTCRVKLHTRNASPATATRGDAGEGSNHADE
jgi:hypothetical protein